ncbi:High mobility group box domain [Sesbania bispinosa]|nr:High mobility group box domain [Sesbania bispinosa]
MTSNSNSNSGSLQLQLQQLQNQPFGNGNGNENERTSLTPINPYPLPTALYQDLTRDSNLFWEKLQSFHKSFGTKFKVPTLGGKPLDLYRLFIEVTSRGGLEKVIVDRKWKDVILAFRFPDTITSASFMVRRYYLSLLYHFEQVYFFRKHVPPSSTPDSPAQTLGSVVHGTIDGKFDYGYVVTVNLGSEELKGVLYHVPDNVSRSTHAESTPSTQNRKRSRLALRDPSRPKSNRSGYNFFFAENYARLKPSFYGQERAISKRIGFLWSNLTEAERQVYQEKGVRDKERYKTEMLDYKSNNSTPQPQ